MTELVTRIANVGDLDDVMELALTLADENAMVPPSKLKILNVIWAALHREGALVGLVGPPDGKPQGFVLMRVAPPWYGDEVIIEECGIFVHPEWRQAKGGRATLLYKLCKQVSERMKTKLLIGVLSRHRTESKVRYYERHFGAQAGAYYIYDPARAE
jgi:hypothetical protein